MDKIITSREANQNFARVLRDVEGGKQFTVTRNGRPVARIIASPKGGRRVLTPEQERAHARAMARAREGWPLGIRKFDRDEIYEEHLRAKKFYKRLKLNER
ncbi:MAG: type II toxin-antitoxin system prevent-host-death family antitoxin [Alphaproteobacteria bacterium]|nr:type II toxin-antitoxin system prevent-host-death family antitoxin [Alphaproteobacteria bacterium]